jgi:hypothetical protein
LHRVGKVLSKTKRELITLDAEVSHRASAAGEVQGWIVAGGWFPCETVVAKADGDLPHAAL